jgi:hypothetical protein
MNTLATTIRNSKARWRVAERFKRVSYGPWLFTYEGLRERLSLLESIAMRVTNKIYYP